MKLNESAWNDYLEYRKEQKMRKLKDKSLELLTKWLSNYSEDVQGEIIYTTIRNGWIGLFPPKDKPKAPQSNEDWDKIGRKMGILPKMGESYTQYINRLKVAMENGHSNQGKKGS